MLPPLVLLLILGLAAVAVTTQPVAVVNLDGGGPAAGVMERTALGFEGFRAAVMSPAQADQAFSRLEVSANSGGKIIYFLYKTRKVTSNI